MKKYLSFAIIVTSVTLSACGSGGTSTNSTGNTAPPTSGSQSSTTSNVVPIVIDGGPTGQSPLIIRRLLALLFVVPIVQLIAKPLIILS